LAAKAAVSIGKGAGAKDGASGGGGRSALISYRRSRAIPEEKGIKAYISRWKKEKGLGRLGYPILAGYPVLPPFHGSDILREITTLKERNGHELR